MMNWRPRERGGSGLWMGGNLIATAEFDGVMKHPDGKQWAAFVRLPLKSSSGFEVGRFSTEAELRAAVEAAVHDWLEAVSA